HFRLHRFALEENDVLAPRFSLRRQRFDFSSLCFPRGRTARSFFVDVRWEIARLSELADRFIRRGGVDEASQLLTAPVESNVVIASHGRYAKAPNSNIQAPMKLQTSNSKRGHPFGSLELGVWNFSGAWSLEFG